MVSGHPLGPSTSSSVSRVLRGSWLSQQAMCDDSHLCVSWQGYLYVACLCFRNNAMNWRTPYVCACVPPPGPRAAEGDSSLAEKLNHFFVYFEVE